MKLETKNIFENSVCRNGYQIVLDDDGAYCLYHDMEWIMTRFAPENILAELSRMGVITFVDERAVS